MEIKIPVHSQRAAVRCRTRLGTPQNAGYTNGPLRAQSKEVFLSILRREASVNCWDMKVSAESTVFRELRWQRGVDKYSVLMAGVRSAAGAVFCFSQFLPTRKDNEHGRTEKEYAEPYPADKYAPSGQLSRRYAELGQAAE